MPRPPEIEELPSKQRPTHCSKDELLLDGFKNPTRHWDVLDQQVFFAEKDRNAVPKIGNVPMDVWTAPPPHAAASPEAGWTPGRTTACLNCCRLGSHPQNKVPRRYN